MYGLARKILFALSPELSHEVALDWMGAAGRTGLLKLCGPMPLRPVSVMGLEFPNPVGLAAGLDKNGDYFNALGQLGFGFIEIGTVTPKAQPGNAAPRLFRLPEHDAIINRMGFNNKGIAHLVEQVQKRQYRGVLGINIGKNKDTTEQHALQDYATCLRAAYPWADYITVNISSPNTPGLRNLQFGDALNRLLEGIKLEQQALHRKYLRYVPIAVKIAPDMTEEEIRSVASTLLEQGIDGVIATNTTTSRKGVQHSIYAKEAGGLSGAPVREQSTAVIRTLSQSLNGQLPIIGVGGIVNGEDAKEKLNAGASLVQIYSGFIYRGPSLIREIIREIK